MEGGLRSIALVAVLLASTLPCGAAGAQPARIGRLPLLAQPRPAAISCRSDLPLTAELRSQGITSMLEATDTATGRSVSLLLSNGGHVNMLSAMMRDSVGHRLEIESVTVFFSSDGQVRRGVRRAMTGGVPARLGDDRHSDLLPTDTAQAIALARVLQKRCAR
jgi:hypothetical protein